MKDTTLYIGTIEKVCRGGLFLVDVNCNTNETTKVWCKLSGKMMINKLNVVVGDSVKVIISEYDINRGIIVWRDTKTIIEHCLVKDNENYELCI